MLVRVIDTETTGIPSDNEPHHALCEIGWCDIVDGKIGEPHQRFVNPGRPIPTAAKAIHHITDDMVADAIDPSVACRTLMEGQPDVFFAHNAEFDRQFFRGGDTPFLCSYKIALRFWPDAEKHTNQFLRYYLDVKLDPAKADPPHRAGADAYVTAHIAALILAEAEERGIKIEDMARWSKGPALLPRITFGKHKGMKWEEAPTDYLEWIAFKSEMDRDAKANAKHWLKERGIR